MPSEGPLQLLLHLAGRDTLACLERRIGRLPEGVQVVEGREPGAQEMARNLNAVGVDMLADDRPERRLECIGEAAPWRGFLVKRIPGPLERAELARVRTRLRDRGAACNARRRFVLSGLTWSSAVGIGLSRWHR